MSNEFFLDTAYAIALAVESDEHHQRAEELAEQRVFDQSAFSGRLKIAQQFTAGMRTEKYSVVRVADG